MFYGNVLNIKQWNKLYWNMSSMSSEKLTQSGSCKLQLLDACDLLARIQAFGTTPCTIHDSVASIQLEFIINSL
jgi:hypothetical protein